jgi:hypothetical protein
MEAIKIASAAGTGGELDEKDLSLIFERVYRGGKKPLTGLW